jgi:IMP dehydrogenase
MAKIVESPTGALALTFDDVLLQPGHSEVMPGQVDLRTRIAADIELNLPLLSAAMDTVTESRLAIAMAQAGGIGVIHRNLTPERQAEEVRQVKKFGCEPCHHRTGRNTCRCTGAYEGASHFRHSGC